jgi:hypothetical protein
MNEIYENVNNFVTGMNWIHENRSLIMSKVFVLCNRIITECGMETAKNYSSYVDVFNSDVEGFASRKEKLIIYMVKERLCHKFEVPVRMFKDDENFESVVAEEAKIVIDRSVKLKAEKAERANQDKKKEREMLIEKCREFGITPDCLIKQGDNGVVEL